MCLYPTLGRNRKYTRTKKNEGIIPLVSDKRLLYVPYGCGNCIECRKQKAREWQQRLLEDIKTHKNGQMITLTLSNESIKELHELSITKVNKKTKIKETINIRDLRGYEKDNAIATVAVRRFNERWRKEHGYAVRHWLVTELGHKGTENIHLHGIIWTDKYTDIRKHWKYGFVWDGYTKNGKRINYVNSKTVNYSVKYVHKIDRQHKYYKSIILSSPGIGNNYTKSYDAKQNKFNGKKTNELYRNDSGYKMAMPTYWRNKIYTEEEREQLWLNRLDKQERWVCGERADVSQNYKQYDELIEYHRKRNTQLGYGDNKKNWKREYYEQQRREIIINTRIKNASGGVCLADGQGNRLIKRQPPAGRNDTENTERA